jgi:hypothetical protein
MNIIKGIDRIAIVLAIGMAIVSFFYLLTITSYPYPSPDYIDWYVKCIQRASELENLNPLIKDVRGSGSLWGHYDFALAWYDLAGYKPRPIIPFLYEHERLSL